MRNVIGVGLLCLASACGLDSGDGSNRGGAGGTSGVGGQGGAGGMFGCTPGEVLACVCVSGAPGAQSCLSDGSGFGSCVCATGGSGGAAGFSGSGGGECRGGETCNATPLGINACGPAGAIVPASCSTLGAPCGPSGGVCQALGGFGNFCIRMCT